MNALEQFIFEENAKYLDTKFEPFAKEIMALQGADVFTFLNATDVHYIRKYAMYTPVLSKLREMIQFSGHIGGDLLALTGDLVDGNTTLQRQYRDLYDILGLIRQSKTTAVVLSKGNHDDCSWYAYKHQLPPEAWIDQKQWFNHAVNPLRVNFPMMLDEENPEGGYYAIDFPLQKVRVINVNTNDVPIVVNGEGVQDRENCAHWRMGLQEKQLKWLAKTLQLKLPGWSVMFFSHMCPLVDVGEVMCNRELVSALLQAYQKGEQGQLHSHIPHFEAEVDFDFTENAANGLLPWFYGHTHLDDARQIHGVTCISTRNLMGKVPLTNQAWDQGEDSTDIFNGSWDCVLVNKSTRTVTVKRFGMPQFDRVIPY